MKVEIIAGIDALDARQWNRLSGGTYPFLQHEFMLAAEQSGCVSPASGWQPMHVVVFDNGRLRAAMPLYEKTHSWGEFVFDWAWAHAYERVGLDYYPKLVSASPFTPAQSPRLLVADSRDQEAQRLLAITALELAKELGSSSLHVQFPLESELSVLTEQGFLTRKDCQFHWTNRNYANFDEFLATFTSAKRKKARRDRRHVAEQGVRFRWLDGRDLTRDVWRDVYALISTTFLRRGSMPYLSDDFFCEVSRLMPDSLLVVLGEMGSEPISAAVFYRAADTLYGRYWGCSTYLNSLHFETCYYQGIDYCIEKRIQTFEPGTQGEHKVSRGFTPVTTWSAHWLAREEFFSAVGEYLDGEREQVSRYMDSVGEHTPYRAGAREENA